MGDRASGMEKMKDEERKQGEAASEMERMIEEEKKQWENERERVKESCVRLPVA